MSGIRGSQRLENYASKLIKSLRDHTAEIFPPDAQKTLRSYSMKEVGDFIGINPNTFRHYIKTYQGRMPTGQLVNGNRRYFTAGEMQEIREFLWKEERISINEYRRRQPGEEMKAITVFNLKGGVSKTSSCVHLAEVLALRGYRVLAVDLDAQASMTNLFGLSPEAMPDMPSSYNVISYKNSMPIRDVIRKTYFPGIDILPASMDIIEFEYETALSFRGDAPKASPFHSRMAEALDQVRDEYDIVLFDTPPQLSFAVIAALFASNGMLIPLTASMLDVMSLATFMEMASELMKVVEEQDQDKTYDFIKFLITRYETGDNPQLQVASFMRTVLGDAVMSNEFLKSTAIGDAANTKQPLFEVEPRDITKSTYDRVMSSISGMADEIEDELRKAWGRP
ncbi:plasmid partitioning protein RepA [Epibacterium sp. DP7N7-1]|nr:plasmid partitioning protein RepA [Epibacterium sp. DP7N7-1]